MKDRKVFFCHASKNTERLLDLVKQLLDLSRLEAGMLHLQTEAGDLNALLRQLAGNFQSPAMQKQLDFSSRCSKRNHCY